MKKKTQDELDAMTEEELENYYAGFHDVYDWLRKSPSLRDSFLRAVAGPGADKLDEKRQREILASYTRGDVILVCESGFC